MSSLPVLELNKDNPDAPVMVSKSFKKEALWAESHADPSAIVGMAFGNGSGVWAESKGSSPGLTAVSFDEKA